ncbi:MAG: PEGA domain-containing protein [Methanomicrobiales archaeon]|nr:PEGA domain-containing protein [Methanomicrobiales archaeon]
MYAIAAVLLFILAAAPAAAQEVGGDQGWVTVHCNVDGALIDFDGESKGTVSGGSLTVPVYTTGTPYQTATASKSGYISDSTSIPSVSAGETVNIYLTLNPEAPTTGTIGVTSVPSGANVYLDGVYNGRTPQVITGVAPGDRVLTVEKEGYQSWQSGVSVTAGVRTNVNAQLVQTPTVGSVSIATTPSGATIYIDGTYMGTAPKVATGITAGKHLIELELSGYQEYSGAIVVVAGQTTYVSKTLSKIPQPTSGEISVTSSPTGAYVYLDGAYQGRTFASGGFVIIDVAPGSHTVTLKLDGYQDQTTAVQVTAGQTAGVSMTLSPATPVTTTGSIQIDSQPAGANVYVDNAIKGITPLTVSDLAPGQYTVTLRLAGYEDWSTTVTVSAGGVSSASGNLLPASQPTATQSGGMPVAVVAAVAFLACGAALRRRRT